jgi:hypothetical protein
MYKIRKNGYENNMIRGNETKRKGDNNKNATQDKQ